MPGAGASGSARGSGAHDEAAPGAGRGAAIARGLTGIALAPFEFVGGKMVDLLDRCGGSVILFLRAIVWLWRGLTQPNIRLGHRAIIGQVVRIGVRSIFIVALVSGVVGLILAMQLAPPLDQFGRRDLVANIIGVAVLRELGPLIGAIVLTGFAGAAIAAEIGTMVVGEEVEALEAHALNPIRFLVMPRVLASIISMTVLGLLSSATALVASVLISVSLLGIPYEVYMINMREQVSFADFFSGFIKGGVFGLLIGLIACYNGLRVTGGAEGVGNATTTTVVQCIVAIIFADLIFTFLFYALNLV